MRSAAGAALHGRQCIDAPLGVRPQLLPVGEEILVEQREQQVVGRDLGVAAPARNVLRSRNGLLALDRQLLEIHVSSQLVRLAGVCEGW